MEDTRPDAPELLGRLFIQYVRARRGRRFRELVASFTNHLWGLYYNSGQLTDEDRIWAMGNRPNFEQFEQVAIEEKKIIAA